MARPSVTEPPGGVDVERLCSLLVVLRLEEEQLGAQRVCRGLLFGCTEPRKTMRSRRRCWVEVDRRAVWSHPRGPAREGVIRGVSMALEATRLGTRGGSPMGLRGWGPRPSPPSGAARERVRWREPEVRAGLRSRSLRGWRFESSRRTPWAIHRSLRLIGPLTVRKNGDSHDADTPDPDLAYRRAATLRPPLPRPRPSTTWSSGPARRPVAGKKRVVVHYVGVAWSTREEFDASWNRGDRLVFGPRRRPGHRRLGPGRPRACASVVRAGLTIPPHLGYGAAGAGARSSPMRR